MAAGKAMSEDNHRPQRNFPVRECATAAEMAMSSAIRASRSASTVVRAPMSLVP